jgi:hypothetical protein
MIRVNRSAGHSVNNSLHILAHPCREICSALAASKSESGIAEPPSQQFSINHIQEPNQPLNSNQPHKIAPMATTGSQLNSNGGSFRNLTSEDKGGSRREKRQKLDKFSNAGQGSVWQSTAVEGQRQDSDQLQPEMLDMQAPLYPGPPFQQGMLDIYRDL